MDQGEQNADRDEQDAEDPVEDLLAAGVVGEALEGLGGGGEEEPHDQDVDHHHGGGQDHILRQQRLFRAG